MFRGPDHMASRNGCSGEIVEGMGWKSADRVSLVKQIGTGKIPAGWKNENEPCGWPTG
jgi:hypothetical protein